MHFTTPENPKARIQHQCSSCFRVIEPGETYQRGRGYDSGDAWTWRCCEHCQAIVRIYDPRDWHDLISEEGMRDWIDNGARDVRELRHMAQLRMKWRTKAGTLLPVPTYEPTDLSSTSEEFS